MEAQLRAVSEGWEIRRRRKKEDLCVSLGKTFRFFLLTNWIDSKVIH